MFKSGWKRRLERREEMYMFNPIPLLLLNRWVGIILAPAFILPCKILTLRIIFEFYFRIFFHKTKVARNYEKIKVKRSQTWPPSRQKENHRWV